jgi:hypothetical protein
VPIRAGENGGRTLPHKNIVTAVHLLGKWKGARLLSDHSRAAPFRTAVLVQDGPGGAIFAARRI